LAQPRPAFASTGDRFFEDHAATDKNEVAVGPAIPRDAETTKNRAGKDWFWIR
jgi:hypothetical protein